MNPCEICGDATTIANARLCNGCWEAETRLGNMKEEALWHFLELILGRLRCDVDVDQASKVVVQMMTKMTPEERTSLRYAASDVFCDHCGYPTNGRTCHCWNDE